MLKGQMPAASAHRAVQEAQSMRRVRARFPEWYAAIPVIPLVWAFSITGCTLTSTPPLPLKPDEVCHRMGRRNYFTAADQLTPFEVPDDEVYALGRGMS
jgi:hypothetical protein